MHDNNLVSFSVVCVVYIYMGPLYYIYIYIFINRSISDDKLNTNSSFQQIYYKLDNVSK